MRGQPALQWLIFAALWIALLVPLFHVTRQTSTAQPSVAVASESLPVWLTIRFSTAPASFLIRQDNRVLLSETNPERHTLDREVEIVFDAYGAEIVLEADLPDTETAVEIIVEPDGRAKRSRTLWVSGAVEETISFSWGRNE